MKDSRVAELLDRLTPSYDDRRGDWEHVAADAAVPERRARARRWPARAAAIAAAAVAIAAVVLAWPVQSNKPGLLERARAAIGDGPVLHVVLRGEWGGTLVDLTSGKHSPVHGENEVWYDTERGRVHLVSRLGGVVQGEELYRPKRVPADLAALGRDYKQALDTGTAKVIGDDILDGEPVVWITIHSELLPDVADGKDHEWVQQVAVSRRTFKPVALREARDGAPAPGTLQRVLDLELLAAGGGDFSAPTELSLNGVPFRLGRDPIALDDARTTLGRDPVWLGAEYGGLPLAQAFRETTSRGRRHEVLLTGAEEAAALRCTKLRGEEAGACYRALGPGSIVERPDGVYRIEGPVVWIDEQTSLVLFYGTVGDNPHTYEEDRVPLYDRGHLTITQSVEVSQLRRGTGNYVPAEGSVFIAAGERTGFLQIHGIQVAIGADGEPAILAAARALERMPG